VSTNFPNDLDSFVDPQGNQSLSNPPHSAQHANANDAIAALEAKVGVDNSITPSSIDYQIKNSVYSVPTDAVGQPNGIASLDGSGFVPLSELPVQAVALTLTLRLGGNQPDSGIGLNSDYVLDADSGNVWGPKASGVWPSSPLNTFNSTLGFAPGYQQLNLTYNGSPSFAVDCMVGEGWDSAVGGSVFGMFPVPMLFGESGPNLPCSAYIDGSGVVQSFTYFYNGGILDIYSYDGAGNETANYIRNPYLQSYAGIVIGDSSTGHGGIQIGATEDITLNANRAITINGSGNVLVESHSNVDIQTNGSVTGAILGITSNDSGGIRITDNGGSGINIVAASADGGISIDSSGGNDIGIGISNTSSGQTYLYNENTVDGAVTIGTSGGMPINITTDAGGNYSSFYNSDIVANLPTPVGSIPSFGFTGDGNLYYWDTSLATPSWIKVSGGGTSGYRQLTLTYNGSLPFITDVLVGENYDPANYGLYSGVFPIEPVFGPTGPLGPKTMPCSVVIDNGVITQITTFISGGIQTFDSTGTPVQTWITDAVLTGDRVQFYNGNQAVNFYTADVAGNLNGSPISPAFGWTADGNLYYWNTNTTPIWMPVIAGSDTDTVTDIGMIYTEAWNNTQQVKYAQEYTAPPYYSGQNAGTVCQAPPYASDWLPLNVVNAGDDIVVNFGQSLIPGLFDTVDITGTLLVWDLAGENLLSATFTLNGISNSTGNQYLTLTAMQYIGTDLSIASPGGGGNSIHSANGGIYNVLINTTAEWD